MYHVPPSISQIKEQRHSLDRHKSKQKKSTKNKNVLIEYTDLSSVGCEPFVIFIFFSLTIVWNLFMRFRSNQPFQLHNGHKAWQFFSVSLAKPDARLWIICVLIGAFELVAFLWMSNERNNWIYAIVMNDRSIGTGID